MPLEKVHKSYNIFYLNIIIVLSKVNQEFVFRTIDYIGSNQKNKASI